MKKMNNLIKVAFLVLYTVVIFLIAIFIVNGANKKSNRFPEPSKNASSEDLTSYYSTVPYNEDITVNVQVIENRESTKETKTSYEYTKYDVYLFVTKKIEGDITNLYAYLCSKSGEYYSYTETSTSKSIKGTSSYQSSAISMLNSSTEFAYLRIMVDEVGKLVSVNDRRPEEMYVKVAYDVQYSGEEKINSKELNYKFRFDELKLDLSKLDSFEQREIGTTYIKGESDRVKIKAFRTTTAATDTKPAFDNFKISIIDTNADNMEANVLIDKVTMSVYGVVTNEKQITSKYFDKYVRLFHYSGSLNRGIRATRTATISQDYGIEKLYFSIKVDTTDGNSYNYNYYVNVSDLQQS